MKVRKTIKVSPETYDKVKKEMTCKWYVNGGECRKGLPGTECDLIGCVAWQEADWHKEKED